MPDHDAAVIDRYLRAVQAGETMPKGRYDELELQFLDPASLQERFIKDADFIADWGGPDRVFAIARIRDATRLFADPTFHYHILATGAGHYLFSNQP